MPFAVTCNLCGKTKQAPDDYDGKKVKCKCGATLIAKKPADNFDEVIAAEVSAPNFDTPAVSQNYNQRPQSRNKIRNKSSDFVAALLAIFSFVGGGVCVLAFLGSQTVFQEIISGVMFLACTVVFMGSLILSRLSGLQNTLKDIRDVI